MNLSKEPTEWLAIKAYNTSQFDGTDICFVKITDELMKLIKKANESAVSTSEIIGESFNTLSVSYHSDYWKNGSVLIDVDDWQLYSWSFVETNEEELQSMAGPLHKVSDGTIIFDGTGCFFFECYDGVGDRYYTDAIYI